MKSKPFLFLLAAAMLAAFCTIHGVRAESRGIQISDKKGREVSLYKESYALLLGVSHYSGGWPNLPSVQDELEKVRAALESQGFSVTTVADPTASGLREALSSFVNAHGFDPDNRLLIYFSGHGYTRKPQNQAMKGYIVPADAPDPRSDERGFLQKALSMEEMEVLAKRIEARHALFVFDSCFSGTIFQTRDLPGPPPDISDKTARPVREFFSAGDADQPVPSKSVFTPSFVRGIEGEADLDRDGYVTGTELGAFLQKRVMSYRTGQSPQWGKIRDPDLDQGDFVFSLKSAGEKPEPPLAALPSGTGKTGGEAPPPQLSAREREDRDAWAARQQGMDRDFGRLKQLDDAGLISSSEAAQRWSEFVYVYGEAENPFSQEDDKEIKHARDRWEALLKTPGAEDAVPQLENTREEMAQLFALYKEKDGKDETSPAQKAQMWDSFLEAADKAADPNSLDDAQMLQYASSRSVYWKMQDASEKSGAVPKDSWGIVKGPGSLFEILLSGKADLSQWAEWQKAMNSAFQLAKDTDRDGAFTPNQKIKMWASFLDTFSAFFNPNTNEDDEILLYAANRYRFWDKKANPHIYGSQAPPVAERSAGDIFTNSLGMDFVWCPPGTFLMGSPANEKGRDDDEKQHKVTLTQGFYIGKLEITQEEWRLVMGENPSHNGQCGPDCPVERVSWNDVQTFINRLNSMEKTTVYRLPTEAEWEYACRAGTETAYCFGSDSAALSGFAWFFPPGDGIHEVLGKFSNAWGIFDMHGNVSEWCSDWYDGEYYLHSPEKDPKGPAKMPEGGYKVARGGSFASEASILRSANRLWYPPDKRDAGIGFRLVCSAG